MPRNPLQLVFCSVTLSLVPGRTLELELTSFTASSMAILATLPMVESNAKTPPTFTTAGLEVTFLLNTEGNTPRNKNGNNRSQTLVILHDQHFPSISQKCHLPSAAHKTNSKNLTEAMNKFRQIFHHSDKRREKQKEKRKENREKIVVGFH